MTSDFVNHFIFISSSSSSFHFIPLNLFRNPLPLLGEKSILVDVGVNVNVKVYVTPERQRL